MNLKEVRLLNLIKSLEIGGIEKSVILLSNHLADKIGFTGIFAASGIYSHDNIVSEKVQLFSNLIKPKGLSGFVNNMTCLLKVIKSNRINVIMYHHRVFLPYIMLLRIFEPSIIIIYKAHSVFDDMINKYIIADRITAVSERAGKTLGKKKPATIIHNGIEPNAKHLQSYRRKIKNIGYVGRFHKSKSIDILIEAFDILCKKKGDISLVIIGEGEQELRLKKIAAESICSERIFFYPPHWNEDLIYEKIDLLILPSTILEGFGLVLPEAMSRGIPVIVSDFVSSLGLVKDNYNGLTFRNNDAGHLAEIMSDLIDNEIIREALIKTAFDVVTEKYSIEQSVNKHLELFTEL